MWLEATFDDYYCASYSVMELKAERLYWCSTCKTRLGREEAMLHWSYGHRIFRSAYVEPDVKEEIYEG
ncbi:MAG: hypothetical protein NZ902_04775 [Acidilobaceae archaeon]|nr:hypothetical protein [Acidilobaceae archaeon]MCX8165883.1 hypothetical protein [Acidilobaceae archaeon]MDW7974525.1 hypothetical protein [Sulfolobales archaeon]